LNTGYKGTRYVSYSTNIVAPLSSIHIFTHDACNTIRYLLRYAVHEASLPAADLIRVRGIRDQNIYVHTSVSVLYTVQIAKREVWYIPDFPSHVFHHAVCSTYCDRELVVEV